MSENYLLKLDVFSGEYQDESRQLWREKALEVIDDHQMRHQLNSDA